VYDVCVSVCSRRILRKFGFMALITASRISCFISAARRKCIAASVSSFFTAAVKHRSVSDNTQPDPSELNAANSQQFTVFYRFPYITTARFISRLKLYQTGFVVLAVPPAVYYYNIGAIDLGPCVGVAAASTLALVMLYFFANFFQRVVGLVALSGDQSLVRLSHLTFFGGRNDVIVPVDDIVPLSDVSERRNDIFVKVRRYSTSDTLYMSLLYGHIENAETFQKVFGSI